VRVTAVAKGPKVPVAGGGHKQSAIRHAVESFEGAVALRCVERRCDRRTTAAQNKLSPLRDTCRQQEPPTGITSANATPRQLQEANPSAPRIIVICDNARYYKAKAAAEYLKTLRLQLGPLPAYSPNLNLIERFWKFFKKQVLYNRYYARFADFRETCNTFFADLKLYEPRLRTLLTENFQIIGN
jgi:transposase